MRVPRPEARAFYEIEADRMTEPGPVSVHLEADLREQARQHGIVWLDKEGTYTDFADASVSGGP
jgi:hypothetical protein